MIVMRIYNVGDEVLLAACDENILGQRFTEGDLQIYVDPSFYGDAVVGEESFINGMKIATIANLVGNFVVGLAIKHGFIDHKCVLRIGGVAHAQMARMW